ncbi:dihydrolipoyl dehydrogenase family protein [Curvivirga aplysinae]|uniref:dihydrolipoyl dehydrogenase family protein n=1 Tax=Curvivirga aplysinae TaxID=2529852 RepID=UPI0012BC7ADE|nr:FAD-dependent oxidoreductase [Curvivirga aplysinae]MTI10252.1 dihydrolipoamide dehydrogenase [Curvivirga aplysinae]
MTETVKFDICVIGAGSGGLSVAAGAVQMGASVALIEKGKMGGDCLNYGCVPSKALLAASHAAQSHKHAANFGVTYDDPKIDMSAIRGHVDSVIKTIEPHDSVERFEGLGVKVYQGAGKFVGPREVQVNDTIIQAKYIVVSTGSSAFVPPISGVEDTPYFTNETIFFNEEKIDHLVVIGGGPIGAEMAQAHAQLGIKVSVVDALTILNKDDEQAVQVVREQLVADGIDLYEGTSVQSVAKTAAGIEVKIEKNGEQAVIDGSHILMAVGRAPNVHGLDLEKANIKFSPRGIEVDERLRSSNKRVFAIGDVTGGYQFTHMAGYDAGIVIRNALFKMPAKVSHSAVPWVTYTSPEIAQVGVNELTVKEKYADNYDMLEWHFKENDRAQAEGKTKGFAKAIVDKKGKILGCTMVGDGAGELIAPWCLAISKGLKIGDIAGMILPYPTRSEISKRVAGSYYTPKLFSDRVRKIVSFLMKFS